ncbi:MAG TPA: Fic family protein [Parafilimonas sp.]|nr:Fic family protein [Parafilimonas sp.]
MQYNWQQPDWLDFKYDISSVLELLLAFAEETGHISGILKTLPPNTQLETTIDIMVAEAMKTSEIEGEYLSRKDVASSIRNKLGLNKKPDAVKDKMAKGAGELMVEVRATFVEPLTKEKLFAWHGILLGTNKTINTGTWRKHNQPMQVVSGAIGKEKIHFEAPPSSAVPKEMKQFIKWFNDTSPKGSNPIKNAPVRAAIAHLYFESIHPIEDGNGRIGRAIAEKALSQTVGRPLLLSLSRTIEANKNLYYKALESAQKSNEITKWVQYFVQLCLDAQKQTHDWIDFLLKKMQFFDHYKSLLNERHLKVINKMFDAGPEDFEGGMNARKYVSITKASKATATRDLQYLSEHNILTAKGGGRSTHYVLNI